MTRSERRLKDQSELERMARKEGKMIDPNKKYRTRDGREVRIYSDDGGGSYPIHGAIKDTFGWEVEHWTGDGRSKAIPNFLSSPRDLIEVKPEVTVRHHAYLTQSGVFTTLNYSVAPNAAWRKIGVIDITHDGENLLKVEIVK